MRQQLADAAGRLRGQPHALPASQSLSLADASWLSLEVRGTYMTDMASLRCTLPSASLSITASDCGSVGQGQGRRGWG